MSGLSKIKSREKIFNGHLTPIQWKGLGDLALDGFRVWTSGTNVFYSTYGNKNFILDKKTFTWLEKTWLTDEGEEINLSCNYIVSDGEDVFYTQGEDSCYILDRENLVWKKITMENAPDYYMQKEESWTDGKTLYNGKYRLNKETFTWEYMEKWTTIPNRQYIWTDGINTYLNWDENSYILNTEKLEWIPKTIKIGNVTESFADVYIYCDGINTYHFSQFYRGLLYIYDIETSSLREKIITEENSMERSFDARKIWTDGENFYYSYDNDQFIFDMEYEDQEHVIIDKQHQITDIKDSSGVHGLKIENNKLKFSKGVNKWEEIKITPPILISSKKIKRKHFTPITLSYSFSYKPPYGEQVCYWKKKAYYIQGSGSRSPYVFCFSPEEKKWTYVGSLYASDIYWWESRNVWSDGTNLYYGLSYILDFENFTAKSCSFSGFTGNFRAEYLWTDGKDIYFSQGAIHLKLDIKTKTWSTMSWTGLTDIYSNKIWSDEYNIYWGKEKKLNISEHSWEDFTWNNAPGTMDGYYVWTDGKEIYHTYGSKGAGSTYLIDSKTKTFTSVPIFDEVDHGVNGGHIWTDGYDIYYTDTIDNEVKTYILVEEDINLRYRL